MTFRKILFLFLSVIMLCLILEGVSYFILSHQGEKVGFFWNRSTAHIVNNVKGMGYDEIDPLCGWSMSTRRMKELGYEIEQNCVVLRSAADYPVKPLRIFITGGSTTDIAINKRNWPVALQQLLQERKVNAIIYVAALGGYSTSQELFTLLRNGLTIEPDIHISYSGANEGYGDFGYISDYEQSFYETALKQNNTTVLLPSATFLIRKTLHLGYIGLSLKYNEPQHPLVIWKKNMRIMEGIAREYKYKFIGALQPVAGMGAYADSSKNENTESYRTYFPKAKEFIRKEDTALFDLTGIFDTATGKVFTDDCHINDAYQTTVAQHVLECLIKAGCIK